MLESRFTLASVLLALPVIGALGTPAWAQTSAADSAAAQALFDEGKALMKAGHYDQACPKLEESQRLDSGGGTLVVLALCYESLGRTGSAWATWNAALSGARAEHRADREALAQEHIRGLDEKMPRARVVVVSPPQGLEVRRDGEAMRAAQWGTPVPIDPGTHSFDATAPGKQPWHASIVVAAERRTYDVAVPELKDAAPAPPVTAAVVPPAPSPVPPPPRPQPPVVTPPPQESSSNPLRTVAWMSGGVAVVTLGLGVGFTASAASKWSDAHGACPGNRCTDPAAVKEGSSAGSSADVATAFFAVGGVSAALSVLMFIASGGHDEHAEGHAGALRLGPMIGPATGLVLGGSL